MSLEYQTYHTGERSTDIDEYGALRSMAADIYSDLAVVYTAQQEQDIPKNTHAYIVSKSGEPVTVAVFNSGLPGEYYSLRREKGRMFEADTRAYDREEIICYHKPPEVKVRHSNDVMSGTSIWTDFTRVTDEAIAQKILEFTDGLHVEIIAVTDEDGVELEQKRGIGQFIKKLLMHIDK